MERVEGDEIRFAVSISEHHYCSRPIPTLSSPNSRPDSHPHPINSPSC